LSSYTAAFSVTSIDLTGFEVDELKLAQRNDPSLVQAFIKCQESSQLKWNKFEMKNEIMYYQDSDNGDELLLVIPYQNREYVLPLYHNHEPSAVHMAMYKMMFLFKKRFFWN
jgi:hypothetical protein